MAFQARFQATITSTIYAAMINLHYLPMYELYPSCGQQQLTAQYMQKENEEAEAAQQEFLFVEPQFRIGQRVEHKTNDMTGVIVGWDRGCCESDKWQLENQVADLSKVCPISHGTADVPNIRSNLRNHKCEHVQVVRPHKKHCLQGLMCSESILWS